MLCHVTDQDHLTGLLEDGSIDEVLGQLQSGKEASLYVVRRGDDVFAAKVYKARDRRSFKNNAVYTEGRKTRNTRDQRALARGTRHGKATQESAWNAAEAETLGALHAAGCRVPRVIGARESVVLMELVVDAHGEPAPRLIDARPTRDEAKKLHAILLDEIVKMLLAGTIHGDLSAYNILLAGVGPIVIDFPQAVSASHNQQAKFLLVRDVENVTDFLAGFDPSLAPLRTAGNEIWTRYERGELAVGFVPGEVDADDPEARLARQIAEAVAIPRHVARALGKQVTAKVARERAAEAPAREPARHHPRHGAHDARRDGGHRHDGPRGGGRRDGARNHDKHRSDARRDGARSHDGHRGDARHDGARSHDKHDARRDGARSHDKHDARRDGARSHDGHRGDARRDGARSHEGHRGDARRDRSHHADGRREDHRAPARETPPRPERPATPPPAQDTKRSGQSGLWSYLADRYEKDSGTDGREARR
jgi:RIO kinase 1